MSDVGTLTSGASGSITGQLDVQWIVEQLIYAKQESIRDLETYELFYETKKEAFQELNTKVSALESTIYTMNTEGFDSKTTSLSRDDYLSATASTSASSGDYSIVVKQLAKAQSEASTGFSSADDQVLQDGKLTIQNYDGTETLGEVDFTGSSMSLNDMKYEINSLNIGVTATVVNFGTSTSPDYKIQITADDTGVENGFTLVETLGGGGSEVLPGFTEKVAAQDAQIYVNTDPATNPGDYITRSSNTIDDVISGVTLNLLDKDDALSDVTTLTVTSDTTGLKENIQSFVDSYNEVMDFLNGHFTYDEENERAGVLSGEAAALKVKSDLLSIATSRVSGLDSSDDYKSFAVIGLEINQSGQLEIDDEKMDDALENHLDSVKRILTDVGSSTHSEITYVGSADETVAGEYDINITKVAEQGVATGVAAIANNLAQDEVLTITYGSGTPKTVNLTSGTSKTAAVAQINSEMDDANIPVFARINDSGQLELVTDDYGSSKSVSVVSDIASGSGGTGIGTTTISDSGEDVEGTIGGNAASGSGRMLTGTEGDSKGLIVSVATTSLSGAPGGDDKGAVRFTRGIGESLREQMYEISFPYTGLIAKNIDMLDDQLDGLSEQIDNITDRLAAEEDLLIDQYTKANQALSEMSYLLSTLNG